jgi:hypothetical protein
MYRKLNPSGSTPREISEVVNNLVEGKSNNTGNFTKTNNVSSSTLIDERIGYDSVILFTAMNNHAATEMGHLYVSALNKGSATISHRSNNSTAIFKYIVVG